MKRLCLSVVFSLSLIACTASGEQASPERSRDPQAAMGKTWQWQEIITPVKKITASNPEKFTLLLDESGRAEFQIDCNRGGGSYRISEGKLSFGPIISTRMACPGNSQDSTYLKYLQEVISFFIEGNQLYLELPVDAGTMRFRLEP